MKDGRTHLAHKAEHAVDMESGAVLARDAARGRPGRHDHDHGNDHRRPPRTCVSVADDPRTAKTRSPRTSMNEVVADKGYHSNETMTDLAEMNIRSYVSEPDRGRRDWTDKPQEQDAVYANRRSIRGVRGKRLMRKRGELIERSFAHNYETGAMRRTHLRHHDNIAKRLLIHVGGFNLSLVMRKLTGFGKPRRLQGLFASIFDLILAIWNAVSAFLASWPAAVTTRSGLANDPLGRLMITESPAAMG